MAAKIDSNLIHDIKTILIQKSRHAVSLAEETEQLLGNFKRGILNRTTNFKWNQYGTCHISVGKWKKMGQLGLIAGHYNLDLLEQLVGNQNFSIAFQKETSVSGNGYHWIEQ
jgi:hypothetical protein